MDRGFLRYARFELGLGSWGMAAAAAAGRGLGGIFMASGRPCVALPWRILAMRSGAFVSEASHSRYAIGSEDLAHRYIIVCE